MWIEDYRDREGLALDEFTFRVNLHARAVDPPLEAPVSDTLIHMLERSKHGVTHPRIANVIAEVCGATAEQRDMIVAEIHHGTWEPKVADVFADARREKPQAWVGNRSVVKVDKYGNVLDRFESVAEASRKESHSEHAIRKRCNRKVKDQLYLVPYTYRFAVEWDKMTTQEKLKDVGGAD